MLIEKEVKMISWRAEHISKRPLEEGAEDYIIPFSNRDLVGIYNPNNDDAIIVSMMIAKDNVKKILVESRSSAISFLMMPLFKWIYL